MKNLIILLAIFSIYSCSSDSDNQSADQNNNSNTSISPPEWIQGVWLLDNGAGGVNNNGYIFTSDDFLLKNITSNYSFKNQIITNLSAGSNASVLQIKTNTEYNIDITLSTVTSTYQFVKINPTKIEWINDPLGNLVNTYYIKQ